MKFNSYLNKLRMKNNQPVIIDTKIIVSTIGFTGEYRFVRSVFL